jgi:hypothetical protein
LLGHLRRQLGGQPLTAIEDVGVVLPEGQQPAVRAAVRPARPPAVADTAAGNGGGGPAHGEHHLVVENPDIRPLPIVLVLYRPEARALLIEALLDPGDRSRDVLQEEAQLGVLRAQRFERGDDVGAKLLVTCLHRRAQRGPARVDPPEQGADLRPQRLRVRVSGGQHLLDLRGYLLLEPRLRRGGIAATVVVHHFREDPAQHAAAKRGHHAARCHGHRARSYHGAEHRHER